MKARSPHANMKYYFTGSFLTLFFCTLSIAGFFTYQHVKSERERAEIYSRQIKHFFEFEYRQMNEEMWTGNYESIVLRVQSVVKQLGGETRHVYLLDPSGACFGSIEKNAFVRQCESFNLRDNLINRIDGSSASFADLTYNDKEHEFIYTTEYSLGKVRKGFMIAVFSDPFQFDVGNRVKFFLENYWSKIAFVLLIWLIWNFASRRFLLNPYMERIISIEKQNALGKLSQRIAHDIRSPLETLLSLVRNASEMPEAQRKQLKAAASRIQSLADQILDRHRATDKVISCYTFVHEVVESITAEKTVLLRGTQKIEVRSHTSPSALTSTVAVSASDLSRVLSNLVNNSIEAITGTGIIEISVEMITQKKNFVEITIKDDGSGIDHETIEKLLTVGGSFGKKNGRGIGLQHARETIRNAGGTLNILSEVGKGTSIRLLIPVLDSPSWLPSSLPILNQQVVVLDDDESTHLNWKEPLRGLECTHLYDPQDFDLRKHPIENTYYIFDHEFSGSLVTGLDLISQYHMGSKAVLVTSYFNDPEIQEAVLEAGCKMLPKYMIPYVKIEKCASAEKNSEFDLVLIDNDELIRDLWSLESKMNHVKPGLFSNAEDVFKLAINKSTPIYVDRNLDDGTDGLEIAKHLYDLGYQEIYLTTGDHDQFVECPKFLTGVIGKGFPVKRFGT